MGSRLQRFAWFRRKQELHFVHHRHANSNFAVIHFFWDRILGTYRRPDAAQTQANGTLQTGGSGRFPPFETDVGIEASMTLHESNHGTQNAKRACVVITDAEPDRLAPLPPPAPMGAAPARQDAGSPAHSYVQ